MKGPVRIAILASGAGSNALALLAAAARWSTRVCVPLLVCDQPAAPVLGRLADHSVRPVLLPRDGSREDHEAAILDELRGERVDWIFLAGYMRLLSAAFIATWQRLHGGQAQIVNIHPSRLPGYPGLHAIERAIAHGETEIGVTLHHVDPGMDTGAIIAQDVVARVPDEPLTALEQRVHALEHRLYTDFLADIAQGVVPTRRYREVVA